MHFTLDKKLLFLVMWMHGAEIADCYDVIALRLAISYCKPTFVCLIYVCEIIRNFLPDSLFFWTRPYNLIRPVVHLIARDYLYLAAHPPSCR